MGSIKDYFKGLGQGVTSLFKGLSVTGKEFVTPKITEKYPDNRENMNISQRFRARLELVYDKDGNHKCIACGTCERVCPNGTITLETKMTETWDGKKKKKLEKYIYDLGSCTFCQLCVQNCPTHALDFSNDFEQAVFTRDQLVKKLNYLPEKPEPEPTPEQRAKFEAEKKAKAEAALYRSQYQDACEMITLQVTQLEKQMDEALEKVAMAESNLDSAEENLRMATSGVKNGAVTTNTALSAHSAWLQAHSEYIDAGIEARMVNVNLMKAEGEMK